MIELFYISGNQRFKFQRIPYFFVRFVISIRKYNNNNLMCNYEFICVIYQIINKHILNVYNNNKYKYLYIYMRHIVWWCKPELLLFATTRSIVRSVKVSIVEIAKRTNWSHRIRHRSSGDKSVGCVVTSEQMSHILWWSSTVCTDVTWFA